MRFPELALLVGFALTACQTSHLTYATASGASAVEPIYRDQALSNFAKLLDEPNALPSQISLVTGTMQTNSSVTPNVTFPLSSMFARAISATTTDTTSTAGASATIQGSLGFQLNYIVAAPTDTLVL